MASRRSHAAYHSINQQPTIIINIIRDASVPILGTIFRWMYRTDPQLRCFAACSGFHDIGSAPRNLQLLLNLLVFMGAWLRRDAIASYVCLDAIASYGVPRLL